MNNLSVALRQILWNIRRLWVRPFVRWLLCLPLSLLGYCSEESKGRSSVTSNGKLPPFVHRPLETANSFRILQLLPSADLDAPIECRLHHCQMGAPQYEYTAISYVWGNKDLPKVDIVCDDSHAEITPSLHSALSRLRSRTCEKYLWADALCIDQRKGNNTERPSQVRIMDEIYARAQQVVIDLGLVEEELSSVLPNLDRYYSISPATWSSTVSSQSTAVALDLLSKEDTPGVGDDFWKLFPRFMQRPWFTRVWIIQEFTLAKTHKFMIGKEFREGTFLQAAIVRAALHLSWLYANNRHPSPQGEYSLVLSEGLYLIADTINAIQRLVEVKSRMPNRYTFCELISMSTVLFGATNIRDRAYALRGLASDPNLKRDLAVDYAEEEDKFLLRLTRYLLRAGYSVYPLYHCVGDRKGFRSWALSLGDTIKDDLSLLIGASGKVSLQLFNACGALDRYSCMTSVIRPDGLRIRGCTRLDTIDQAMNDSLPPKMSLTVQNPASSHSEWLRRAFEWMCSMTELLALREQDKSDFMKQCWRTLIADVIVDPDHEQNGQVRTRNSSKSELCLDTWTRCYKSVHTHGAGEPKALLSGDQSRLIKLYGESLVFAFGRRLAMTKTKRWLCLIPAAAKVGDDVVLIRGCPIPFVLRRNADEKGVYFRIVGCVYVHGIMDGEISQQSGWIEEDLEIW